MNQREIEMQFSRKNIHNIVLDNIENSFEISYQLHDVMEQILTWVNTSEFYESKHNRWQTLLKKEDLLYILKDIMVVILELEYTTIQAVCGKVASQLKMSTFDAVKCIAEICVFMAQKDLFNLIPAADSETGGIMLQTIYQLDSETKEDIRNKQYLPPMIEPPAEVRLNYDYSYHTEQSWMILGKGNGHHKPIALDVINILNQIPLELDSEILAMEETPNKKLDTVEKMMQFNQMKNSSRKVYGLLVEHSNEFFLTWKYDKRGRIYSQGYHVNIQSTEYKKALINLKNKLVITT